MGMPALSAAIVTKMASRPHEPTRPFNHCVTTGDYPWVAGLVAGLGFHGVRPARRPDLARATPPRFAARRRHTLRHPLRHHPFCAIAPPDRPDSPAAAVD